jgi:hypothetical protein
MRWLLASLLAVVGVGALGGAAYGLGGAPQVPSEWLDGSPFDSYLVPSLYLGLVVGGSHLFALALVLARDARAHSAVLAASVVLASWIVAQVAIIGFVSGLQPAMLLVAACDALLAWHARAGAVAR